MPPLILVLAGIAAGGVLVRLATRESARVNRELQEARERNVDRADGARKLRPDPGTGSYRPE